jgi:hypothetical protein
MSTIRLAASLLFVTLCACQSSQPSTWRGPIVPGGDDAGIDASTPVHSSATLDPFVSHVASAPDQGGAAPTDEAAELAKKLSNPVADLISVPIQGNWDTGIGPEDADRTTINVQPVIPFTLNADWNVISRTIIPFIDAESPTASGSDESGLGDISESLFFSPKKPTDSGWIWGAGPIFAFPTASDDTLGNDKWSIGPTVVVLKQDSGWTYGALANHLWSVAGDDDRADVNATFLQPFAAFTTKSQTTFTLNTESSYNWTESEWTVPINLQVTQLVKIGKLPMSFGIGYREYVEAPDGGPDWGLRFIVTFLFPK